MLLALLTPAATAEPAHETLVLETQNGNHSYNVEVAKTMPEKAKGLMFRRSMPQDHGMIFLYDSPRVISMWMRNTYIPLDMIFITEQGSVLRIEAQTEPHSTDIIYSGGEALAVLELNGGEAARIGLRPGDRVEFPGLFAGAETEPASSGQR